MNSEPFRSETLLQELRLGVVQFDPLYRKPEKNQMLLAQLMEDSMDQCPQILICPEMCTTGYVFRNRDEIEPLTETATGKTFQFFSDFCRRHRIYLAYGYPEKAGERLYNSQNLIDPDGTLLLTYRKKNLFPVDENWASAGENPYLQIQTPYGKMGLGICMDLNAPDFMAFHAANKTDLILFSANWLVGKGEEAECEYWLRQVQGFQGILAFANRGGNERGENFCGNSCVIEANGVVAQLPKNSRACLVTEHKLPELQ